MRRCRHVLIGAASALAIAALPLNLESMSLGSFEPASALAKGGNGGNGGGHGNGGGKGGGNGHSGAHGKSADAGGRAKSGGMGVGSGHWKSTFGQDMRVSKGKKTTETKVARAAKASKKSVRAVELAALPELAPVPFAKPKEEKLNARLAGLHSLKRNYHAYLNSQAPRMASIRAFVLASANLDIANEKLADAQAEFDARLAAADIVAFDGAAVYDDPTLDRLEDRLDYLDGVTPADPAEAAELEAERDALQSLLDSREAAALEAAEDKADLAAVGTDDAALKQALLDAANENRVAQYGEEDYVNDDVMDWAKDVLGVGDDFGKIDEVRETLEIDEQ
jgi:hypothetical protein